MRIRVRPIEGHHLRERVWGAFCAWTRAQVDNERNRMTTPIDDLSVVYVDTSGITLDPYPKEQGTWYKGDDYLVVVRPSFISFWIRRTSRRYDIQGGTLQDEIAAFCAMTGEPLDDAGFRAYHRRADAAYFTRGTVDERDDRDERQGMVGHIVERPT